MKNLEENATAPRKRKLLACHAVAHHLEGLAEGMEIEVLEIALHVNPDRLKEALQNKIEEMEEEGAVLLLGYGLCGRATEGLVSKKSTLVLPRVDDCIGALLGSRARHKTFMRERPGSYFLEPTWVDAEMNIFVQLQKNFERIPPEKRERIARMTLAHYRALVLLTTGAETPEARARCQGYADEYGLKLMEAPTDLRLLRRLMTGPWDEAEFVVCPPGEPVPFF